MKKIESIKEFGGWLNRYQHESDSCHCTMTFSVYLPPQAEKQKVPAVYWLDELGMPEAVWIFEVNDFGPLIIAIDSNGRSIYKN